MHKIAILIIAAAAILTSSALAQPRTSTQQPERQLVVELKDGSAKSFDYTPELKLTYSEEDDIDILTVTVGDIFWQTPLDNIFTLNLNPVMAEGIYLDLTEARVYVGETVRISATVVPEDATDKTIVWQSLEPEIATVSAEGVVTGVNVGETVITASCGNLAGSCSVSVVMNTDFIQSTVADGNPISVSAAAGTVIIRGKQPNEAVSIFNAGGVMVYLGTDNRIPVSTPGTYIVTLRGKTFKIIL